MEAPFRDATKTPDPSLSQSGTLTTPDGGSELVSPAITPTGGPQRIKRPWGNDESMAFYDGIKLYGKDFDTVGKYMARRKFIKSKESIKNFFFNSVKTYTRTLSLTDEDFGGIQRDARELFLVINACEWKRKTINMKITADKFRELVFDGQTSMKVGKRTLIIRTPTCHSLSRYFSVKKMDKIPSEVFVHLEPTSNGDHVFMRNRDQNPYLRVKLNTNDRISKFLEFLHRKWSFGGQMSPVKVTLWPDSSCELASLCVYQVENSPFISLSMNKLIRNVDEQKKRVEVEKPGLKTAVEVNTKTKPTNMVIYPRAFNLTDTVIAQGIDFENVKNAIVAELFVVCGRKNPIQLRYQVRSSEPEPRAQEPWKLMISLLERGYGDCLLKKKDNDDESQPKKKRKRIKAPQDPSCSSPVPSSALNPEIVRRETDDFEYQLAFLKKMPRKKTKNMSNLKDANGAPALATATPSITVGPSVEAPSQDTVESLTKQVFVAPKITVTQKKTKKRTVTVIQEPPEEPEGDEGCKPSTSNSRTPPKRLLTDFSEVFVTPTKRMVEVELQRKRTDDFLSSLRTPEDTPNQTPKKSSMMQQYFGDELSMSPNSTRHASILTAGPGGPSTTLDFADLMYKQIQDSRDESVLSATGDLDISTTEIHRHYEQMISSSRDSHDYVLDQFKTKTPSKKQTPKNRR